MLSVEAKWLIATRDRAPSHDGGSMWIMLAAGSLWLYARPSGASRGKWRIPDGKDESGLFSCSEFRRWYLLLCCLRTASVGPCCSKHFFMY
jgi:hypothetical protein